MTRPTRGREVPQPPPDQRSSFPAALASALERVADRDHPQAADRRERGPAAPGPAGPGGAAGRERLAARASVTTLLREPADPAGRPEPGEVAFGVAAPARGEVPGPERSGTDCAARTVAALGGGAADTPEPDPDHLIEVVGADAVPLWELHLGGEDRRSRERLIEHYGPLVRGVAAKLAVRLPASVELADLVQAGTFGLMDAVDRFDPRRAVRFDGYAAQRVRGAMLDELRSQDWVPRTVRARNREVERAREVLHLRGGRAPTDRELAGELGICLRELRHAVRPVHLVSVEMLEQAGAGGAVVDVVVDDTVPDPVLVAVRRETTRELGAAVAHLGERDRLVLRLYYLENRTLAEIGKTLGVTESRVCQLHSRIVSRLRGRLEPLQAC